jgi:hypothetical protein
VSRRAGASRRYLRLFLLPLLLAGACGGMRVSRYYWGANLHSDGVALVRPVPTRVDTDLQPFSVNCVESILKNDVDSLRKVASGDLSAQLEDRSIPGRLHAISEKYLLAGTFEQIDSTGGGIWMDEMISRDPYKLYSFFVTEFLLPGKANAHAFLLIQRNGNDLSLLGFNVHSAMHQGAEPDVRLMPATLKGFRSLAPR